MEERIWLLVSLQLSGEATSEELEELDLLLQQHPRMSLQVSIMKNIWQHKQQPGGTVSGNKATSFDRHLQRLSNHHAEPVLQFETDPASDPQPAVGEPLRRNSKYKWIWWSGSVAASLLISFFLIFPGHNRVTSPGKSLAGNTVSTRPGSKSKIELPDGTQVWLNADSKIKYDPNFAGTIREVELSGEAYFDVVKDKTRPFIIHANSIDLKVLGTSFNVRSYPNEKTTETALIQGSVEVTLHDSPDKKIILRPNEKLVVKNNTSAILKAGKEEKPDEEAPILLLSKIRFGKTDTSSSIETMWVKNKLAFENETFERMVSEIERWYNVAFTVKDEQIKTLHFTGIFENKPLAEVMEALSFSYKFQYEIKNDKVIVW